MSLVRRFVLLAALTLCGGTALAACQSAPGVAAQVGDVRLTDARVEEIVEQVDDHLLGADRERLAAEQSAQPVAPGSAAPTPQGLPADVYGNVRRSIVEWTVFNEVAREYAAEKGLSLPAPDYATAANQIGLPADNPYVTLYTETVAWRQLLSSNAQRAEPTEEDLQEAFRRAVAAGAIGSDVTYEQVRSQLAQVDQIRTGVWIRNELAAVAERIGVSVSPRYRPIEVATGSVSGAQGGELVLVALPLGDPGGSPAVRDAS
jgi:hypothetical protein